MKIRHRLILMLGLPFACQMATTSLLIFSFAKVDQQVASEIQAKRIVEVSQEGNAVIERAVLVLFAQGAFARSMGEPVLDPFKERLERQIAELKSLVGSNTAGQAVLAKTRTDVTEFLQSLEELATAHDKIGGKFFFAQFMNKESFMDSQVLKLKNVQEDIRGLIEIYRPIASELSPAARRTRANLRIAVLTAVLVNAGVVAYLAVALNRDMLSRLKILMNNMAEFSKGQPTVTKISGDDELVALNESFVSMAEERHRWEEVRKSIRAMVNHDLRSPLTSMGMRVELMLDTHEMPAPVRRDLERLGAETQRLWRLSNTLLDVEKLEDNTLDVRWEICESSEIVSVAVAAMEGLTVARDVTITQNVASNAVCYCDKDRTIQVLVNLLSNAIKFSPKGSVISITATFTESNTIRFEVTDQGTGVPEDKVSQLFAKFSQLEQASETRKQGSGLGLYICRMLIHGQSGTIGYLPGKAGGSCFWFELGAVD